MKIVKETTIELTPDEVRDIISEYLFKQKGFKDVSVRFDVGAHEDPSDWRGEFPASYELDKIICTYTGE